MSNKHIIEYSEETDKFNCPDCEVEYDDVGDLIQHLIMEEH